MATGQFMFVAENPASHRNKVDGSQIRSHCMKGLNKRANSRRSKREAKQAALVTQRTIPPVKPENSLQIGGEFGLAPCGCFPGSPRPSPLDDYRLPLILHANPKVVKFADKMKKPPHVVFQSGKSTFSLTLCHESNAWVPVIVYLRVVEATYLIDSFVHFGNPADPTDIPPMDNGNFMGMLLVNSIFHDLSQHSELATSSHTLLVRNLHELNQTLSKSEAYQRLSTVCHITFLAVIAACMGDITALGAHMAGMQKIITLRGGIESLSFVPQVLLQLEMLDLALCLGSGSEPYFLKSSVPREMDHPLWEHPLVSSTAGNEPFLQDLDPRIMTAFQDLKQLIASVNDHVRRKTKLSYKIFQPAFSCIAARTLRLQHILEGSRDECLCLGMLVFIISFFQNPSRVSAFAYLSSQIRTLIQRSQNPESPVPRAVTTWLLMLSAISVFNPGEAWVRAAWADVVGLEMTWKEVHGQLKEMIWVDSVHNGLGKAAYKILSRRSA